jgi:hypothetical protein
MQRPTLATFRRQFPSEAMGVCQSDPMVRNYCNDAQERLLMDPLCPEEGFWGGWVTLTLTGSVSNGSAYVTCPREIGRLIVTAVCQQPIHIRNGFYEYLNYGRGMYPKSCGKNCNAVFEAYERDNVFTLADLQSTAQTVRLYPTDARDSGRRVLLQGEDANAQVVLTTDPISGKSAPGEYISLKFPFVDSANQYTKITGIQKDGTWGNVQFFQVDPATLTELPLSVMEPNEGSASYRRYLVSGIPNLQACCNATLGTVQLTAQGRLDFIPVENETDYLTIPNVPALVEEAMSIRFSRMDATEASTQSTLHHAKALNLLNGQIEVYLGKQNAAIGIPLFGSQKMRASFR